MAKLLTFRLSAAFAAVVGIALAFTPLLAVHGVESALALGLLLPPWVGATAASYAERNRDVRGIDLMLRAIGAGLSIWAIPVALLGLNSLRVRQCAPGEGLAFMVLGPAVGCMLAACAGVWVVATTKSRRFSPWIAASIPLGAALLGLWAFYATPTVYVFGAFAGYFPGAIYDDQATSVPDGLNHAHDSNGNVTGEGHFTMVFDAFDRPVRVGRSADGAPIATYKYDALGRRVWREVTNSGDLDDARRYLFMPDGPTAGTDVGAGGTPMALKCICSWSPYPCGNKVCLKKICGGDCGGGGGWSSEILSMDLSG